MAQWVKNWPAMQETQETWVQSQGRKDPLEKGTATHSSILARRIPWTSKAMEVRRLGQGNLLSVLFLLCNTSTLFSFPFLTREAITWIWV